MLNKNKSRLQLYALPLAGKRNWHYEVISHDIFDNEKFIEYYTLDHAAQQQANMDKIVYEEDSIPENTLLVYRYVADEDDKINIYNAKRSRLGVVKMLKGKEEGKEFMFSLFEDSSDVASQLLVYGYLTYGEVDKELFKGVMRDDDKQELFKFVAGQELYKEIVKKYS